MSTQIFFRAARGGGPNPSGFLPNAQCFRASGPTGRITPEPLFHPTTSWSDVPVGGVRGITGGDHGPLTPPMGTSDQDVVGWKRGSGMILPIGPLALKH